LSWQEERTVSNSLTLQYDRVVYLLEPTELAKGLRRNRIRVYDWTGLLATQSGHNRKSRKWPELPRKQTVIAPLPNRQSCRADAGAGCALAPDRMSYSYRRR